MYKAIVFETAEEFLSAVKEGEEFRDVRSGFTQAKIIFDGSRVRLKSPKQIEFSELIVPEDIIRALLNEYNMDLIWLN